MVANKVSEKLLQENSSFDKGKSEISRGNSSSLKETTVNISDSNDVNRNVMLRDTTGSKYGPDLKGGRGTRCQSTRLAVLIWLFLEKFVDVAVVFLLTLLAILWGGMRRGLEAIFWPLLVLSILLLIGLIVLYRIPWVSRSPGCFLYKLVHLLFLTAVFFLLALHVPNFCSFLSPFFALITTGTATGTYLLLCCIAVTHKHFCKVSTHCCALWLYGLGVPLAVLIFSQLVYLCGGTGNTQTYGEFMTNISVGIVLSFPFSCETVYIYKNFVNSTNLEEFVKAPGLVPGYVIAYFSKKASENAENEFF